MSDKYFSMTVGFARWKQLRWLRMLLRALNSDYPILRPVGCLLTAYFVGMSWAILTPGETYTLSSLQTVVYVSCCWVAALIFSLLFPAGRLSIGYVLLGFVFQALARLWLGPKAMQPAFFAGIFLVWACAQAAAYIYRGWQWLVGHTIDDLIARRW